MTDFLVDLGRALDDAAAQRELATTPPSRGRLRAWLPPIAACAMVGVAVALVASGSGDDAIEREATAPTAEADTSLLGTLGVLRRPATPQDSSEPVRAELGSFSVGSDDSTRVRLVRLTPDGRAILVAGPMRPSGPGRDESDQACVYYPDPVDGGGVGCHSARSIRAGSASGKLGPHWHTLVPDEVASIEVSWEGDEETVPVESNFAESQGDGWPARVKWLDAAGRTIKTIPGSHAVAPPADPNRTPRRPN